MDQYQGIMGSEQEVSSVFIFKQMMSMENARHFVVHFFKRKSLQTSNGWSQKIFTHGLCRDSEAMDLSCQIFHWC